jgi:hypothetical protein
MFKTKKTLGWFQTGGRPRTPTEIVKYFFLRKLNNFINHFCRRYYYNNYLLKVIIIISNLLKRFRYVKILNIIKKFKIRPYVPGRKFNFPNPRVSLKENEIKPEIVSSSVHPQIPISGPLLEEAFNMGVLDFGVIPAWSSRSYRQIIEHGALTSKEESTLGALGLTKEDVVPFFLEDMMMMEDLSKMDGEQDEFYYGDDSDDSYY